MSEALSGEDVIPGLFTQSCGPDTDKTRHLSLKATLSAYADKYQRWLRNLFVMTGFLVLNLLAVLGLVFLFFIMLGGANAHGFFTQLHQITRRFLEASADRQGDFLIVMTVVVLALFVLVSALRSNVLRDRLGKSI